MQKITYFGALDRLSCIVLPDLQNVKPYSKDKETKDTMEEYQNPAGHAAVVVVMVVVVVVVVVLDLVLAAAAAANQTGAAARIINLGLFWVF